MKANLLALTTVIIALFLASKAYGQSSSQKKICINIIEVGNGKTMHIDTCFTGLSDAGVQKQLNAMGVNDIQITKNIQDSVKIMVDNEVKRADSVANRIIIVKGDKNDSDGNDKVNVISGKSGNCSVVVIGDNGYSYTTSSGDGSSSETEIVTNRSDKDGDSNHKEIKVIVLHNITVNDLSDSDKLKIHDGVAAETIPFSDLKIYPNPVEATLLVSYSSSNVEPLQITIYDANGKVVYKEKENKPAEQVNKSISLSGYAPGIYFVNLLQGNQQETSKIIVGK